MGKKYDGEVYEYNDEYYIYVNDPFKKGEKMKEKIVYKYAQWDGWHTNKEGEGLWDDDYKQVLGTCQFSVKGCKTRKAAEAKIRKIVKDYNF